MSSKRVRLVILLAVAGVALNACGSSNKSSSSTTGATPSSTVASTPSTTSPGSASTTTADTMPGAPFVVGYSLPGPIPALENLDAAASATIAKAGGSVKTSDADLDPNQQIADIQGFIARHVKVIIIGAPIIPQGLLPVLAKARQAGIKVLAWEWNFAPSAMAGQAPPAPVQGQVLADEPKMGQDIAMAIHQATDGHGQTIYVGYPNPVTGLDALYAAFKAETASLHDQILDEVFNSSGDASGCERVVQQAIARYPDANAVVTYDAAAAVGCIAGVRAAGKRTPVYVADMGTSLAPLLKNGAATQA